MMVIMMIAIAATPLYFFQLLTPLVRLFAVLAMAMDGVAQFVFRSVNLSFASFVPVIVRAHRKRRAYQTDNRQQHNRKYLEHTIHRILLVEMDCKTGTSAQLLDLAPKRSLTLYKTGDWMQGSEVPLHRHEWAARRTDEPPIRHKRYCPVPVSLMTAGPNGAP